jgi:hypothetical protein
MAHSARSTLWKLAQAGALIALLTGAASAQIPGVNLAPQDRQVSKEELEKRQATEDAYKSALKKIPDQKPASDPWGGVRSNAPASTNTKR